MPKGKILVAVLNWGLGHATRSIPLIQELQHFDFQPIIGSDGKALDFLREEFPDIKYFELTSLQFSYSKNSALNQIYLLSQSIIWNNQLKNDKFQIEKIHQQENLFGIISDSRPYCYHENIPSIYLTHQLQVKSGAFSGIATAAHRRLIKQFDECWVPDFEQPNAFCGEMSQWRNAPLTIRHIGILSDLHNQQTNQKYDYAGIISGAEPERTKLVQQLIESFSHLEGKKIIIAGSKETNDRLISTDFEIKGLVNRAEVQHIINSANKIVARGGYSTVMDLLHLRQSALLIPTPGQTEQLYITQHLKRLKFFDVVSQDKLSVERILQFESDRFRLDHIACSELDLYEVLGIFEPN